MDMQKPKYGNLAIFWFNIDVVQGRKCAILDNIHLKNDVLMRFMGATILDHSASTCIRYMM